MTLIAFAARPDGVTMVTDSLTSHDTGQRLGYAPKTFPLPWIDSIMAAAGATDFSALWFFSINAGAFLSFDDLHTFAVEQLPLLWRQRAAGPADQVVIFHAGFSRVRGRFVAFSYSSADDFRPTTCDDRLVVEPGPAVVDAAPPTTVEGWIDVAVAARSVSSRGAAVQDRVPIGGPVIYTTLERGILSQARVHSFTDDDSDPDFVAMMSGTLHPTSVAAHARRHRLTASQARYDIQRAGAAEWVDRLAPALNGDERSRLIDDALSEAGVARPAGAGGRNRPCPCGSGRKSKHCCSR